MGATSRTAGASCRQGSKRIADVRCRTARARLRSRGATRVFRALLRTRMPRRCFSSNAVFRARRRFPAPPRLRRRTFQIASGVYLGFYVLGHMDSVFIFARTYLGIDTGWSFATGAPTGLIKDPWNIRAPLLAWRFLRPCASCGWCTCDRHGARRQ
jgi:hypothetical protein